MPEHEPAHTEQSLLELYQSLPRNTRPPDCPFFEHIAGYYIYNWGIDKAIERLQTVLDGTYPYFKPAEYDSQVLEILKAAKAQSS